MSVPLPSSPHSSDSFTSCSADPSTFKAVNIHTAKCAVCDARNQAKMRRCPGCTYQVCQPCFDRRNRAPLIHGNLGAGSSSGSSSASASGNGGCGSDLTQLLSTPARRRVHNRVNAGEESAGSPTGAGVTHDGDTAGGSDDTMDDNTGTRDAGSATIATTPTPKKRAHPKSKGKEVASVDLESDESDRDFDNSADEDFQPGDASPTPVSKRRRTAEGLGGGSASGGGDFASTNANANAPSGAALDQFADNWTQPPGMVRRARRSGGVTKPAARNKFDMGIRAPQGDVKREPSTLQELIEQQGVDTPANHYDEHLLSRHEPVLSNRAIARPPRTKPRLTASQIHQNFQNKALEQLDEMMGKRYEAGEKEVGPVSHVSGSSQVEVGGEALQQPRATQPPEPSVAFYEWIEAKGTDFCQSNNLSKGAQKKFERFLTEGVESWLDQYNVHLSTGVAQVFALTLDSTMDGLTATQKSQLALMAEKAGEKTLNVGKPMQAAAAAPTQPNMSGVMPSVGLFTVSSPVNRSRGLPAPSSSPVRGGAPAVIRSSPPPLYNLPEESGLATASDSLETLDQGVMGTDAQDAGPGAQEGHGVPFERPKV